MADPIPVNVLIVDDNASQRMALAAVLGDLDLRIVAAASGRDALRRLLEDEFALVLLDVNMPGLDGFETAALIRARERTEQTPIIFVTANSDEAFAARGYSLRAVDYILAPVQPDVLRTKVSVFIELYRKTEQVRRQREALQRYASQLQQLSRASLAINAAQSAETVLRTMTDTAAQIIGVHQATTTAAIASAKPMRLTHLSEEHQAMADRGLATLADSASTLAAPLHDADGRGFGRIELTDKKDGAFTVEDEDILVQLAQMASIAIGNIITAEAREANRLKDEFLGVLSHELRTPLQAMLTWLSILRRENVTADMVKRGLDVIERSARAQAQLIDDLLDVSRIIRGQLRIDPAMVELPKVVDLALETLKPTAAAKSVHINFPPPPTHCTILGDAGRLQQVVWNLVANAIKFTPNGGCVDVRVIPNPSAVQVEVCDTGPGIPVEFLPYVFERFRQADSSAGRSHGGLGLGLAIVRRLVELHGGTVRAENRSPEPGAQFTVTLPRSADDIAAGILSSMRPDEPQHSASPQSANGTPLRGVRVILVEDEIEARDSMTTALQLYGADVVAVDSMASALAALERDTPDILLSDVGMPGGDGYALIKQVRARETPESGRIPAAALTAYVRPEDRSAALRAGFDVHLSKPVEPLELARVVQQLVAQKP
jgi:signal transduction histidine kinase